MKSLSCAVLAITAVLYFSWTDRAYAAHPLPARSPAWMPADSPPANPAQEQGDTIEIPGPLRSFLRMAGISQKSAPEDVVPLFARNIYVIGYQQYKPTEFLLLLERYLRQARELQQFAGPSHVIHISGCSDATPLLEILGYHWRDGCGNKNTSLVTALPERAFLTSDSGFPLTDLEEALEKNAPFDYPYPSSRVPILFKESDWTKLSSQKKNRSEVFLEALLHDPGVSRLYWALSRADDSTVTALHRSPGLKKLVAYGGVLDFYGGQLTIRKGRVLVPGGAAGENAWKNLAGANPGSPGDFVLNLISKDDGWLAAYFDALSRVSEEQQSHFTDAGRLRTLYEAFHQMDVRESPTASSFRPAPALLVLLTGLKWDAKTGEPLVPGNLDTWKQIVNQKTNIAVFREWGKRASHWTSPEQLLTTMFAFSRVQIDTGPLQVYLTLSGIDSRRPENARLSPETTLLLAKNFPELGSWYSNFLEFPELDDESITSFFKVAEAIDAMPNHSLRGDTLGIVQANLGLWQILARQGEIPEEKLNASWQEILRPFAAINSGPQLFDQAHLSLTALFSATGAGPSPSQGELVEMLAGPAQRSQDAQRVHAEVVRRINAVLDSQRLVSVDTLFALDDGLKQMANGVHNSDRLVPLAGELREFEMPRAIFSSGEKARWAPGVYANHHAELQPRTDLTKVIKGPSSRPQLLEATGQLVPFLRDTLVGMNYAYYEPPGAQILHNNPLLVRSHDFSGLSYTSGERLWEPSEVMNAAAPAGGGAFLSGSLSDLPFVLATIEQDFIAPESIQALVWNEVTPDLLVSSTLPRWWNVSPDELHAVSLYQRSGEELLRAAANKPDLRVEVTGILSDRIAPQESDRLDQALERGDAAEVLNHMRPADTFYLAMQFRRKFPNETAQAGKANQELDSLCSQDPADTSWERLSKDFGVPHPVLTQSYARELLVLKPFPPFGGTASRLFAESWESTNLYWARLADEMGYSPAALNDLVPELTRRMIEKIFASDFEDWKAVLRAMQETGQEFRSGKLASLELPKPTAAP